MKSSSSILSYIAVFLLIFVTRGSLLFGDHALFFIVLLLIISVAVRMNGDSVRWHNSLFYIFGLIFLFINTYFYHGELEPEFKRIIIYGISAFLIIGSLTLNEFKKVYLNVVCFISIISIVIFGLSYVINLPLRYIVGDYVTIGHFMYHTIEWGYSPLGRNASFFSEPGCFQYCLNYTFILFIEDLIENKVKKTRKIKLLIVTVAILTCASTTGYLAFVLILSYVLLKSKSKSKFRYLFIVLPLLSVLLWIMYNSENFQSKIDRDNDNLSVIMRTSDAIAMGQMIADYPFVGNGGVNTKKYQKRAQGYGSMTSDAGASNGILVGIASLGIFWLFMYVYFCHKGCKQMYKNVSPWFIVLLTMVVHTNEYFIFYPLIYMFVFPYKKSQIKLIQAKV